jgi:hypothetical protein
LIGLFDSRDCVEKQHASLNLPRTVLKKTLLETLRSECFSVQNHWLSKNLTQTLVLTAGSMMEPTVSDFYANAFYPNGMYSSVEGYFKLRG